MLNFKEMITEKITKFESFFPSELTLTLDLDYIFEKKYIFVNIVLDISWKFNRLIRFQ